MSWVIVPFAASHRKQEFSCGEPELDLYLKKYAGQHTKSGLSRTYVAVQKSDPNRVLGFYCVSMASVTYAELPPQARRKLPKHYPIPAARIGRLAVDSSARGKRIGSGLLMNALARCARAAEEMGAAGIVVDAKNDQAKAFYKKYGFIEFTENPLTLFISMRSVLLSLPPV